MPDSSLSLSPVIAIPPGNAFGSIFLSAKDTLSDPGETAAKMWPAKNLCGKRRMRAFCPEAVRRAAGGETTCRAYRLEPQRVARR